MRSATGGRSTCRAWSSLRWSCSMRSSSSSNPRRSRPSRSRSIRPPSSIVRTWATDWRSSRADAPRAPARRGRRRHRARLPRAHRPVSSERKAALDACERQQGARSLVSLRAADRGLQGRRQDLRDRRPRAHAAAGDAEVRPRARRGAARRARRHHRGLPHEQAPLDHRDARRQPAADDDRGADRGLVRPRRAAQRPTR